MALMSPTDSMFLIGESREQPMHVGSLQVFELPDGADSELLRTTRWPRSCCPLARVPSPAGRTASP